MKNRKLIVAVSVIVMLFLAAGALLLTANAGSNKKADIKYGPTFKGQGRQWIAEYKAGKYEKVSSASRLIKTGDLTIPFELQNITEGYLKITFKGKPEEISAAGSLYYGFKSSAMAGEATTNFSTPTKQTVFELRKNVQEGRTESRDETIKVTIKLGNTTENIDLKADF